MDFLVSNVIIQLYDLSYSDSHIKIYDLVAEVDEVIKKRSTQGLLNEIGRRKWKQLCRPEIKPHHDIQRLAWARRCTLFTSEDWATV